MLAALNPFGPTSQLEIEHVHLDHGGYDRNGKYWGVGPRLYEVTGPDGIHFYLRAAGILDARRRLSDPATLYKEGYIRHSQKMALLELQKRDNPLSKGKAVGLGVAALAAVGGLLYAVNAGAKDKPKPSGSGASGGTGAKVLAPAGATWTTLGPGDHASPGHTYLMSFTPAPGMTLQELVAQLPADRFLVLAAWDRGTVPAGWPAADADAARWRLEVNLKDGAAPLAFDDGHAEIPGLAMFELEGAPVTPPGSTPAPAPSGGGSTPASSVVTLQAIPGDNGYVNLTLGHDLGDPEPGGLYVRAPQGTTIVQMAANPDGVIAIAPQKDGSLLVTGAAVGSTILTIGWNSPGGQPTVATLEIDVGSAGQPA